MNCIKTPGTEGYIGQEVIMECKYHLEYETDTAPRREWWSFDLQPEWDLRLIIDAQTGVGTAHIPTGEVIGGVRQWGCTESPISSTTKKWGVSTDDDVVWFLRRINYPGVLHKEGPFVLLPTATRWLRIIHLFEGEAIDKQYIPIPLKRDWDNGGDRVDGQAEAVLRTHYTDKVEFTDEGAALCKTAILYKRKTGKPPFGQFNPLTGELPIFC